MKRLIYTFFLLQFSMLSFAQTINVLNIPDWSPANPFPGVATNRSTSTDYGYHLNGTGSANMSSAKAKLTNLANFGASGIVNRQLNITDDFGTKGSITNISQLASYDIIYIGLYSRVDATAAFTAAEITILLSWSLQAGKVLMLQEQAGGVSAPISSAMGYGITFFYTNPDPTTALPDDITLGTKLFSGIFGNATTIFQSGSLRGYFSAGCEGLPLAKNSTGNTTILLNQKYRDILIADTDYFTRLVNNTSGGMSLGGAITNDTDKAWANLWAWAVNEVVNNVSPDAFLTTAGEAYVDSSPVCAGINVTIKLRNIIMPRLFVGKQVPMEEAPGQI